MLVQFKIEKELDKKIINEFINLYIGGVDFGKGIIRLHPKLKQINILPYGKRVPIISKYVEEYYKNNKGRLLKRLKEAQVAWYKIEDTYFEEVKKIFGIKRKLKRKYTAYISIINCNPRWTSKKEFCVGESYHINKKIQIICHELTHFFFMTILIRNFQKL